MAILWAGKDTTQWPFTEAETHAAAVDKTHVGLSADFTHTDTHEQKPVELHRAGEGKEEAGRGGNERENNLSFKEYLSSISIISW